MNSLLIQGKKLLARIRFLSDQKYRKHNQNRILSLCPRLHTVVYQPRTQGLYLHPALKDPGHEVGSHSRTQSPSFARLVTRGSGEIQNGKQKNLIPVKKRMLKLFSSQIPSFTLQLVILKNIVTKTIQHVKRILFTSDKSGMRTINSISCSQSDASTIWISPEPPSSPTEQKKGSGYENGGW